MDKRFLTSLLSIGLVLTLAACEDANFTGTQSLRSMPGSASNKETPAKTNRDSNAIATQEMFTQEAFEMNLLSCGPDVRPSTEHASKARIGCSIISADTFENAKVVWRSLAAETDTETQGIPFETDMDPSSRWQIIFPLDGTDLPRVRILAAQYEQAGQLYVNRRINPFPVFQPAVLQAKALNLGDASGNEVLEADLNVLVANGSLPVVFVAADSLINGFTIVSHACSSLTSSGDTCKVKIRFQATQSGKFAMDTTARVESDSVRYEDVRFRFQGKVAIKYNDGDAIRQTDADLAARTCIFKTYKYTKTWGSVGRGYGYTETKTETHNEPCKAALQLYGYYY